jgi:hypothetical protein
MKKTLVRKVLGCALASAFALSVAGAALADDHAECARRLEADRAQIDREVAKHGEHSPAVDKAVDHMEADRGWCRDHKADWDHDRFDVGFYIKH